MMNTTNHKYTEKRSNQSHHETCVVQIINQLQKIIKDQTKLKTCKFSTFLAQLSYLPKNGIWKAEQTDEATSAVLRRRKHHMFSEILSGNSTSIPLASGFIKRAYFVNGLTT